MQGSSETGLKRLFTYPVKSGETISWCFSDNWLAQLESHLHQYLNRNRSKNKNHQIFATELLTIITTIKTNNATPESNTTQFNLLLTRLKERNRLRPKGRWNGKPSYLFELCKFAHQQYFVEQVIKIMQEDIEQREEVNLNKTISDQANTIKQQQHEIQDAQQQYTDTQKILQNCYQDNYNQKLQIHTLTTDMISLKKSETALRNQVSELENSNKILKKELTVLQEEKAAKGNKEQLLQTTQIKLANLSQQHQSLQDKTKLLSDEIAKIQMCYYGLKKWVDELFGKAFGETVSYFIETTGQGPRYNAEQGNLIKQTATLTVNLNETIHPNNEQHQPSMSNLLTNFSAVTARIPQSMKNWAYFKDSSEPETVSEGPSWKEKH